MTNTLLLSGGGDFADPWHPYGETSAKIASILRHIGHSVSLTDRVQSSLGSLATSRPDLLVLNAGNGGLPLATDESSVDAIRVFVESGGPLLAFHVSATSFPHVKKWEELLGGRWERGVTMHPPAGQNTVHVDRGAHAISEPISDFTIVDEMYSYLRITDEATVLARHDFEGVQHPLIWVRGGAEQRVVYDALGHDGKAFESPEHIELIQRAARWLTG